MRDATIIEGFVISTIRSGKELIRDPFQIPRRDAVTGYLCSSKVPNTPTADVSDVAFCQINVPADMNGQSVEIAIMMAGVP